MMLNIFRSAGIYIVVVVVIWGGDDDFDAICIETGI